MLVCSQTACGYFCSTATELSTCGRDCMASKAPNSHSLDLTEKASSSMLWEVIWLSKKYLHSQKDAAAFKDPNDKGRRSKQFNCLPGHWAFTVGCERQYFFFKLNGTEAKKFLKRKWKIKTNEWQQHKSSPFLSQHPQFLPPVSIPLQWCRSETQHHRTVAVRSRRAHRDGEETLAEGQ